MVGWLFRFICPLLSPATTASSRWISPRSSGPSQETARAEPGTAPLASFLIPTALLAGRLQRLRLAARGRRRVAAGPVVRHRGVQPHLGLLVRAEARPRRDQVA